MTVVQRELPPLCRALGITGANRSSDVMVPVAAGDQLEIVAEVPKRRRADADDFYGRIFFPYLCSPFRPDPATAIRRQLKLLAVPPSVFQNEKGPPQSVEKSVEPRRRVVVPPVKVSPKV